MPTPFNELELSIYEHLLLIRIKFTGVYKETVRKKQRYQFLCKFSLVDNSPKNFKKYVISDKGNMYLRYKRRSSFRFWIPVIISLLALLSSYDESFYSESITITSTAIEKYIGKLGCLSLNGILITS